MPAVKSSVLPSALPFWMLLTTSASDIGPIWCPCFAMCHCCSDMLCLLMYQGRAPAP